ncbi:MAG: RecX family transcriptional regulator [Bacteroidales bacterium]|jgi:regulatory protein|nr:RecX family transcriptional regulator [Bacteroidales bacterium]NPV35661.1 RecX family transcriptional regulator [Bacteroidales bacterium]
MDTTAPDPEVILEKLRQWCAASEHCSRDVAIKLQRLHFPADKVEDAIATLRKEGFIDDERFARAFVRGKFQNLKWGRQKIANELRARGFDKCLIDLAMEEIQEEEYFGVVEKEINKKLNSLKNRDSLSQKAALLRFASSRGYELSLVSRILKNPDIEYFNNTNTEE